MCVYCIHICIIYVQNECGDCWLQASVVEGPCDWTSVLSLQAVAFFAFRL